MDRAHPRWAVAALGAPIVALVAVGAFLGSYPLLPEEARYAELAREIAQSGWVVPRLNGVVYLEKPPLLSWLGAWLLSLGLGAESALRLASAAGSLLATGSIAWFATRAAGARAGVMAAALLTAFPFATAHGRVFATDAPFHGALTLALAVVGVEILEGRARTARLLGAGVALAAATLLRGPVASLALFGPVALFVGIRADGWRMAAKRALLPSLVACALSAPWFVAAEMAHPGFFQFFFVQHNLERVVASEEAKELHREPFWFYLPILLGGCGAAALAVPWSAVRAFARREEPRIGRALGFALAVAGWMTLLFTVSSGKRASYVLTVFPWLAFALACAFEETLSSARARKVLGLLWAPSALVAVVAVVALLAKAEANLTFATPLELAALSMALLATGLAPCVLLLWRRPAGAALCAAGGVALGLATGAHAAAKFETQGEMVISLPGATIPLRLENLTQRRLARRAAEAVGPKGLVADLGRYRHATTFYAGRLTAVFGSPGELEYGVEHARADPEVASRFRRVKELPEILAGPMPIALVARWAELVAAEPVVGSAPIRGKAPFDRVELWAVDRVAKYVVVTNRPAEK
ncbi:MAG: glycosyltransferase family 39 protein [Planctomycetes bacterium]|nr:glycosyltransferase family 39 protein [Planctomycetota bacterium]